MLFPEGGAKCFREDLRRIGLLPRRLPVAGGDTVKHPKTKTDERTEWLAELSWAPGRVARKGVVERAQTSDGDTTVDEDACEQKTVL